MGDRPRMDLTPIVPFVSSEVETRAPYSTACHTSLDFARDEREGFFVS